ncbi:hypothetical protein [Zoo ranavirus]|uniref:Uncharacterized protein n=1 Tax=Zoo ranavirus TaxID=1419340 RepID=A0A3S8V9G3_FRG3V|nr:hypothetical protein [Zoo ranavirus]
MEIRDTTVGLDRPVQSGAWDPGATREQRALVGISGRRDLGGRDEDLWSRKSQKDETFKDCERGRGGEAPRLLCDKWRQDREAEDVRRRVQSQRRQGGREDPDGPARVRRRRRRVAVCGHSPDRGPAREERKSPAGGSDHKDLGHHKGLEVGSGLRGPQARQVCGRSRGHEVQRVQKGLRQGVQGHGGREVALDARLCLVRVLGRSGQKGRHGRLSVASRRLDGQEKVEKRGLFSLGARDGIRDVRVDEYWDKLVIYSFRRYSQRVSFRRLYLRKF